MVKIIMIIISVQENETHKLLWDFEIQTDPPNLGQMSRTYNDRQEKENLQNCGLCYPG